MKKVLIIMLTALLSLSATAQVTWNAKAGLGVSSCAFSVKDGGDYSVDSKMRLVGKIGVGLEYPLTQNISLMPSLEFAMKGTEWSFSDETVKETVSLGYLQIPVMFAYRVHLQDLWNMAIKVGPYFAYALYGNDKYVDGTFSEKFSIFDEDGNGKRFDAGIDVGLDFEYNRFVFGLEYEHGFCSIIDSDEISVKNQAFYVTVGWKF